MTAEPLPPEIDDGKHSMVMKFMDDGWADLITDLRAPIQMPFFVGGEAFEHLENNQGITLNSYMLMCGILITWFKPGKYGMGESPEKLEEFLLAVLDDIRREFNLDSLEQLILSAASKVRSDHGLLMSSRILTAGCNILPESTIIRTNLIMDVWFILERTKKVDRANALEKIVDVFSGINMDELDDNQVEVLDYIYLVSLSFLELYEECKQYFWQTASKRVDHPTLKTRMVGLMEGRVESFDHYRIWGDVVS